MKCPKCHTENPDQASVCKNCGSPLTDAAYKPLDSGSAGKPRKKRWPLVIMILLILLACGSLLGYRYYIDRVEKECLTFTRELFKGLKAMDLSNIEEKYHPEQMPVDPDLKKVIRDKIKEVFENSAFSSLVDFDSLDIDYDPLFDELVSDASYEIISSETKWNQCTVRVTSSNADFSKLPQLIVDQAKKDIADLYDPDNLAGILSGLFNKYLGSGDQSDGANQDNSSQDSGSKSSDSQDKGSQDSGSKSSDSQDGSQSSSNLVSDFTKMLIDWYRQVKDDAPRKTTTADIVFKFKDGKWTIDSFDQELIYSFYGVPSDILQQDQEPAAK